MICSVYWYPGYECTVHRFGLVSFGRCVMALKFYNCKSWGSLRIALGTMRSWNSAERRKTLLRLWVVLVRVPACRPRVQAAQHARHAQSAALSPRLCAGSRARGGRSNRACRKRPEVQWGPKVPLKVGERRQQWLGEVHIGGGSGKSRHEVHKRKLCC